MIGGKPTGKIRNLPTGMKYPRGRSNSTAGESKTLVCRLCVKSGKASVMRRHGREKHREPHKGTRPIGGMLGA